MAVLTHLRSNGATGSLLDLVLTDKLSTTVSTSTHPTIGSSDHLVVESVLSLKNPKKAVNHYKEIWCYDMYTHNKADGTKLINDLQNANWNNLIEAQNVDSATDFWSKTFLSLVKIVRGPRAQNEKFRSNSLPTLVWEHESPLQPMNNRKLKSIWQRQCPKLSFSETDCFPSRCHGYATWLHVFLFFYAVHCNFFSIFLFFSPTGLHPPS